MARASVSDMAKAGLPMPPVCFVVARSHGGNVIGRDGGLPWRLRTDLRRFRELTSGHAVIMGRKTFDSIGRPLPDRFNVVVSRSDAGTRAPIELRGRQTRLLRSRSAEDALFCSDLFTILNGTGRVFVIGGAEIYRRFARIVDRVYLTEVYAEVDGDAFFAERFPADDWKVVGRDDVPRGDGDAFDSTFLVIDRRRSARRLRAFETPHHGAGHACPRTIDDDDFRIDDAGARREPAAAQLDLALG